MDNATYNAWMWQQHLAAAAQRKATATMSMTVTDHHTVTTTMDDTTDDDPEAVAVDATVVAQPGGKKGPKPYEKQ